MERWLIEEDWRFIVAINSWPIFDTRVMLAQKVLFPVTCYFSVRLFPIPVSKNESLSVFILRSKPFFWKVWRVNIIFKHCNKNSSSYDFPSNQITMLKQQYFCH